MRKTFLFLKALGRLIVVALHLVVLGAWLWLYDRRKKIGFWLVWILLVPLVFGRYLWSDLRHGRFRHATAWVKTGLVRQTVWHRLVLGR
ncbi:hypothetical protein GCM10027275_50390 [Rhabdobacter roseus]|uniref:Uncharacterized protein n=1 Tax=Rhabdobacter roseus TaxID=1655419 RepID=A0A840TZQ0_9BACT|nr:hypothetical protein [Rhabdobacter roseus]MBB5287112.1 hypothetical protein [Rhabdobacter roseus]